MSNTATEQWNELILDLMSLGNEAVSRGQVTTELISYRSQIDMNYPLVLNPERRLSYHFAAAEAAWILSGDNRVETIAPWAPSIRQFSDDGSTFFGAYGPKIMAQMHYVFDALIRDRGTRQAVVNIWRENPPQTRDVPCTLSAQWLIRGNKLHCIDNMRSSDAWLGWPYDVFNFSMLSLGIQIRLREIYPDLELGNLTLNAGSQHLYERNFKRAGVCMRNSCLSLPNPFQMDTSQFTTVQDLITFLQSFAMTLPSLAAL